MLSGSPVGLETLFVRAGWLRPAVLTDDAQANMTERRGGCACGSAQAPFDAMHTSVDPRILASIALNESAYNNGRAWPWTLNVAGRGFFFRTLTHTKAIRFFINDGRCDFDVGLMQVNYCWHERFRSAWDALASATNIHAAENILNENYRLTHSAVKAVAYYRSTNPAPGREYLARFVKHLSQIERGL